MPSTTNPSMPRRRQCVYQLHHSVKATGSSTMDAEMAESLGIFIDSSDGAVSHPLPTLSSSSKDITTVFRESYEVARYLQELMGDFNIDGKHKFLRWADSYRFWDPYWGCSTTMTNIDRAEALTVTVHSRAVTDIEILDTEFIACYAAAKIAWNWDSDHQERKKAPEGIRERWRKWKRQGKQKKNITEDNMLGFRSPMRGLPIRLVSIYGQHIRILTTYFTEEYYQSFKNADQSTSGKLRVRIESFGLTDDWEPQINHLLQKLTEPSTWLQELMEISNE